MIYQRCLITEPTIQWSKPQQRLPSLFKLQTKYFSPITSSLNIQSTQNIHKHTIELDPFINIITLNLIKPQDNNQPCQTLTTRWSILITDPNFFFSLAWHHSNPRLIPLQSSTLSLSPSWIKNNIRYDRY